jgi:hypothetical protein
MSSARPILLLPGALPSLLEVIVGGAWAHHVFERASRRLLWTKADTLSRLFVPFLVLVGTLFRAAAVSRGTAGGGRSRSTQ